MAPWSYSSAQQNHSHSKQQQQPNTHTQSNKTANSRNYWWCCCYQYCNCCWLTPFSCTRRLRVKLFRGPKPISMPPAFLPSSYSVRLLVRFEWKNYFFPCMLSLEVSRWKRGAKCGLDFPSWYHLIGKGNFPQAARGCLVDPAGSCYSEFGFLLFNFISFWGTKWIGSFSLSLQQNCILGGTGPWKRNRFGAIRRGKSDEMQVF